MINLSNLQRQVFFTERETGEEKAEVLSRRIRGLNSEVSVSVCGEYITSSNIREFVAGSDVIAECSDSSASKGDVVTAGLRERIPVVVGGVDGYRGQIALFSDTSSPAYTDIFPAPEGIRKAPGVYSPVPGIVASVQTSEILNLLTGITGKPEDFLLDFDTRTMCFRKFSL